MNFQTYKEPVTFPYNIPNRDSRFVQTRTYGNGDVSGPSMQMKQAF